MTQNKFILAVLLGLVCIKVSAQDFSERYHYATKDGIDLYMDEYRPSAKHILTESGKGKPAIIFMFGGSFKEGSKDHKSYIPWFKHLSENGYRVFSIDYRLGMKDCQKIKGKALIKQYLESVEMGVEDLFSATAYIIENAQMLDVDPTNIVISGSSAGAMISLQAEWEISNGGQIAKDALPQGFNYAGVMAFSGAILSNTGSPSYKTDPAPQLLFHGTSDKVVVYNKIRLGKWSLFGSSALKDVLSTGKNPCRIYRFKDYGHEIAVSMEFNFDREIDFLEKMVVEKTGTNIDELITSCDYPKGW